MEFLGMNFVILLGTKVTLKISPPTSCNAWRNGLSLNKPPTGTLVLDGS
jgi:hypothetical protein